ncbi:hypothetical protein, partial [Salmonella enterica]|uniref:hypothetical protein n=1 Tax=Salmonella enterica TaxID=28901 RepID=UPI0032970EF7
KNNIKQKNKNQTPKGQTRTQIIFTQIKNLAKTKQILIKPHKFTHKPQLKKINSHLIKKKQDTHH